MKYSNFFIPTLKDAPSEAEIISHKLMIRAGMIKQSSAGIYSWLPLGLIVLKKIEQIVREEQNKAGAIELLMPTIQSSDLWIKSGRYDDYGKEMLRITDRSGREMLYGPTNEELITDIFQSQINSYKDLPKNLYHIQWKFRDEVRPRFGVMRGREFLMKDSYSFNLDEDSLNESYVLMKEAYKKILDRLGLQFKIVKADSGAIGGDTSEEFHVLAENGEDTIAISDSSDFAINTELLLEEGENIESLQGKPSPDGEGIIEIKKGIEVGHIFQLGKVYTDAMKANVLDNEGKAQNLYMGCYGIGVSRLVAAAIEQNNDDKGIIWPEAMTPFEVNIIAIGFDKDEKIAKASTDLYSKLSSMGYEVMLDDRKDGYGIKMKDAELIGVPINVIIGKQYLQNGEIELKHRDGQSSIGKVEDISTIFDHYKNS
mgnify:CR=1 FL=1